MSSTDDRIVSMTFDNAAFERKMADTLASLDKLTEALAFKNAQDGFRNLSQDAANFDTSNMAGAIENISNKLSAMGAIGFAVIQNLTTSALDFVRNIGSSILDPILTGGKSRAVNIENAKFAFKGLGIDVNAAMDSALSAVKGTAFGLDEAAKAAAQFGASGIGAGKDMTQALRGIAGVAAMTNSSFSEIADIFTQSAATGVVNNQDLQQFATRGLNATAALAKSMHLTEAQVKDLASQGKISFADFSKVMDDTFGAHAQEANQTYTGSLANMHAAMSRLGASFQTPLLSNQKDLFNALSPAIDKVAAAAQPLINIFAWITGVKFANIIGFINALDFSKLNEPMQHFANGIANISNAVRAFLTPVKQAFNEIFPINAGDTLLKISVAFENITQKLIAGTAATDKIRGIFYGLFSILDIGWAVLKGVGGILAEIFAAIVPAGGGVVVTFLSNLGQSLLDLDASLVAGGKIQAFFDNLSGYIKTAITWVETLKTKLVDFFGNPPVPDAVENTVGRVSDRLSTLQTIAQAVSDAWGRMMDALQPVFTVLDRAWDYIKNWFSELGQKIAEAFKPGDFNSAIDIVNVGLLGGIVVMLKKFLDGGLKIDLGSGIIDKIKGTFDQLTGTLKAMQTELKAEALMKIAEALGILTISIVVLSLIDSAKLTKALFAMSVAFGQMVVVMTVMDQVFSDNSAAARLAVVSGAMVAMATAMVILSGAIAILSHLSWGELAKGLTGVAVGLAILALSGKLLSDNAGSMVLAGIAMIEMSIGLVILSQAVKLFATMSWGDMAKGLVGVAGALILVTLAMQNMPTSSVLSGLGLIEFAVGLAILSKVVSSFGSMDWGTMGKGLLGIAGVLLVVAAATQVIPPTLPITAAGLILVGIALEIMARAVGNMGALDLGTMAKGIGGFAAMLLVLAIATNAMSTAIPGAVALVITAGAMDILATVLEKLGKLKISEILTGLGAIAGVLAVLGIASLILEPLIPSLLLMGIAVGTIGLAFALFGVGAQLVANALQTLADTGVAGVQALIDSGTLIIQFLPDLIAGIVQSVLQNINKMLEGVPLLIRLVEAILSQLLDTIIKLAPKIAEALLVVITDGLELIREKFPDFIKTGYDILLNILQGINDNIGDIITAATEIVAKFAASLVTNMPTLVKAAVDMIVSFTTELGNHADELAAAGLGLLASLINGISDNIHLVVDAVAGLIIAFMQAITDADIQILNAGVDMLIQLLAGITQNVIKIVDAVTTVITTFITEIGNRAGDIASTGFFVLIKFLWGISTNIGQVVDTVAYIIITFITKIGEKAQDIIDTGTFVLIKFLFGLLSDVQQVMNAGTYLAIKFLEGAAADAVNFIDHAAIVLITFLNALADAIEKYAPQIREAGARVAYAIIDGITGGLASKAGDVKDKITGIASDALGSAEDFLGIGGPSKAFMHVGSHMAEGMAVALSRDTSVKNSVTALSAKVLTRFQEALSTLPDMLGNVEEFNPTITPVLDLTKVQLGARDISKLIETSSITPNVSFDNANIIATTTPDTAPAPDTTTPPPGDVTFIQNNNSPKALSTSDIYRGTKSQFALAKEELGI